MSAAKGSQAPRSDQNIKIDDKSIHFDVRHALGGGDEEGVTSEEKNLEWMANVLLQLKVF